MPLDLRRGHIEECMWGGLQEGSQGLKFNHSVKQHPKDNSNACLSFSGQAKSLTWTQPIKRKFAFWWVCPESDSVYEQPSSAQGCNEPLSYSITLGCLGRLIRDGHQLSHHFHWEDQQSFAIPVNTSQSPVWAAYCPQAHLQSLVRPNNRDSDTYWQMRKSN